MSKSEEACLLSMGRVNHQSEGCRAGGAGRLAVFRRPGERPRHSLELVAHQLHGRGLLVKGRAGEGANVRRIAVQAADVNLLDSLPYACMQLAPVALDGGGVQPEGDVVDEDPSVHLGEVECGRIEAMPELGPQTYADARGWSESTASLDPSARALAANRQESFEFPVCARLVPPASNDCGPPAHQPSG